MRAASTAGALALAFASLVGIGAAHADTVTDESIVIDFSSDGYIPGEAFAPGGQNGWKLSDANLDVDLLEDAVRFSNAATSGAFTNQLFAPSLARSAGAPEAGAELDQFTAEFTIAAVDGEYQEGLRLEVSPDDGLGSRTGGSIIFHHTDGELQIGAIWAELDQGVSAAESYFSAVLAAVDPEVAHDIKLVHTFREGAQDTVDVLVDGVLVGTVGTLEEYHLRATSERRTINTLFFRAAVAVPSATGRGWGTQPAVPELAGRGFLVSDISYGVSKAAAAAAPIRVTASDLGTENYDRGAGWTTAHGASAGEYNFVLDDEKGAALELVTVGGAESTQSRLLHYVDSGAYPGVDGAAAKLPGHDLETVPLTSVTHSPIRITYSGGTYVSVQMEIWYGWDVANDAPYYSTLYRSVPGTGAWTTADLVPTDQWISSRALVRADGSTFVVASGKASLLDIVAGLAGQQPRVMSLGVNKGRDSNAALAGAVRVSSVELLGQEFVFHAAVPGAPGAPTAALVGADGVQVSWTAPDPGTSPLTGYTVTLAGPGGAQQTAAAGATATSHTFTGLSAGTYTATVVASNALGSSAPSVASAPVTVPTPAPEKTSVTIARPSFSKARQIYGSKDVARVSAAVTGAEGAGVDFYDGSTKLGTAKVRNGVVTLKLARTLKVGKYSSVVARFAGDATRLPATSVAARGFQVVKTAPAKKIRVTGKKFRKNTKPEVTIRVGRFDNGSWATGKLTVRVDGKAVRTVDLKAKHKGKITVTLPKARKAVKVKAGFKATKTVKKSWSKVTRIKVR